MKIIKRILKNSKRYVFTGYAYLHSKNKEVLRCRVNAHSLFNGREEFGENVNFNGCKIYGRGKVSFGDNFHSAKGLLFLTTFHNYNGDAIPYDDTVITKDVVIGDNVWLGMNVTVMGGVSIGEGAIVQAGSVVVKDIPPCAIAGGHPAKVFSHRNKEKYEALKKRKQFN